MIMGSERSSDAQRKKMKELLGVDHVFDIPGLTELYGPGTGLDCLYHEGIHYWADYYILELLDPETLQPVPPGETGEMVVTTLRKEAAPLVRYRTRTSPNSFQSGALAVPSSRCMTDCWVVRTICLSSGRSTSTRSD